MKLKYLPIKDQNIDIHDNREFVLVFVGKNSDEKNADMLFSIETPGIETRITIRVVLFDYSKIKLNCNVVIDKAIKDVNAYLKINVLLMSKMAKAQIVPSMEIHEDDVKAGHGATIGSGDPEQLYYMQSRGLSINQSKKLIAKGFIEEATNKFHGQIPEALSAEIRKLVSA